MTCSGTAAVAVAAPRRRPALRARLRSPPASARRPPRRALGAGRIARPVARAARRAPVPRPARASGWSIPPPDAVSRCATPAFSSAPPAPATRGHHQRPAGAGLAQRRLAGLAAAAARQRDAVPDRGAHAAPTRASLVYPVRRRRGRRRPATRSARSGSTRCRSRPRAGSGCRATSTSRSRRPRGRRRGRPAAAPRRHVVPLAPQPAAGRGARRRCAPSSATPRKLRDAGRAVTATSASSADARSAPIPAPMLPVRSACRPSAGRAPRRCAPAPLSGPYAELAPADSSWPVVEAIVGTDTVRARWPLQVRCSTPCRWWSSSTTTPPAPATPTA